MLRRLKFRPKKFIGGIKNVRRYNKEKEDLDEIRRSQANYTKDEIKKVITNLEKISELPVNNMKYFWLWIFSCVLMGIIQYDNGGDEGGTKIMFDKIAKMMKSSNKD
jgi:hypothetical protein